MFQCARGLYFGEHRLAGVLCIPLNILLTATLSVAASPARAEQVGKFDDHADVGSVGHAGDAKYDADGGVYALTGGGADMWGKADAFQFVYKQAAGDVSLSADVRWPSKEGHRNRKACLIVRQNLEPGSPYADVASHGDGHLALQWRLAPDGPTGDAAPKLAAPPRTICIEKRGDEIRMLVAAEGKELEPIGNPQRLHLREPFYIGLGVCSHDDAKVETVELSNVKIGPPAGGAKAP